MGRYTYTIDIDAPRELAFEMWTDLELMKTWVGGVTGHSEPTGPIDQAGTTYTTYFGKFGSHTEVLDAERPRLFETRSGTAWLRLTNRTTFEPAGPDGRATRLTENVHVYGGPISRFFGWVFGHGSYRGSFLGELRHFGRIVEAEAAKRRAT